MWIRSSGPIQAEFVAPGGWSDIARKEYSLTM